jgi:mannose-6-phosphate isomerase-like protein (cupin superfamily)
MNQNSRRRFLFALAAAAVWPLKVLAKAAGTVSSNDIKRTNVGVGEDIFLLRGEEHGYDSLSLIMTVTQPGGGPPLHSHECEEMHILESGTVAYIVGEERFTLSGPYVQRIPAMLPHAFMNAGDTAIRLHCVFPSSHYTFKYLAPNPLQAAAPK